MVNQHCFKGVLESRIKVVSISVLKLKGDVWRQLGGRGGGVFEGKIKDYLKETSKGGKYKCMKHETKLRH